MTSFLTNNITAFAFFNYLLGALIGVNGSLFLIRLIVKQITTEEIQKFINGVQTTFHNAFVLPDVKPLGSKGRIFWSWSTRIFNDLLGGACFLSGAAILIDSLADAGSPSLKLTLSLCGLGVGYMMYGMFLVVQGRKEQIRIRGGDTDGMA